MVLQQLVVLTQAPRYLVPSSFVASSIDNPDKKNRIIGIIFGHLNLAVRWRERASNCLHQLFCVPHGRLPNKISVHTPLTTRANRCFGLPPRDGPRGARDDGVSAARFFQSIEPNG
jgi:hypothetical protein